jgi:hypothetical protein
VTAQPAVVSRTTAVMAATRVVRMYIINLQLRLICD